jgi:outer membrane protein assembly factor BamE (lipoprotein component of BamABCDE complex)
VEKTAVFLLLAATGLACQSTPPPDEGAPSKNLTTGVVQREIRKGMSGAEVAEALGSPNIVTTDEEGREVWVYERFARDVQTKSSGYFVIFVYGESGKSSGSTRTLTVVIKFDAQKKVRDFAYHASTF